MPHLILEYSKNIVERPNWGDLFHRLHECLAGLGPYSIADMKSRAISLDNYFLSDGTGPGAMVHLTLQILEGRDEEIRHATCKGLGAFLEKEFRESVETLGCSISVEVREMTRRTYYKR